MLGKNSNLISTKKYNKGTKKVQHKNIISTFSPNIMNLFKRANIKWRIEKMSKKMRDRKWKKQVFAAFMAASMAAASVAGGNPYGLTIHAGTEAEKLETEQGMFYVTDGVLTYYEGDATELTISEDVVEIGSRAFFGAKKLKKNCCR